MSIDLVVGAGLTCLIVAQLVLILWNRREMARPEPRVWNGDAPAVSVLVPARNEEDTIAGCLERLLTQDYPDIEILVLDDGSTDATAAIAAGFSDRGVRVVAGAALAEGWTGKNWACHQLAGQAAGDVLCFVDADTMLEPDAVSSAIGLILEHDAGLVSMLPRARSTSLSSAVMLPMISHAVFGLFPVAAIHRSRNPMVAVAFGPFVTVTSKAYRAAGGHAAAPTHVVDDVQLSRNVKAAGYRVRLADGTDLVATRWYTRLGEIWRGFSKNAYGGLGYNPWIGAVVVFGLVPLLLIPFVRVGMGVAAGDVPDQAAWQCLLLVTNRALTSNLGRDPYWSAVFHPLTVAFWGATLLRSMTWYATQRSVVWKDRDVPTSPGRPG